MGTKTLTAKIVAKYKHLNDLPPTTELSEYLCQLCKVVWELFNAEQLSIYPVAVAYREQLQRMTIYAIPDP